MPCFHQELDAWSNQHAQPAMVVHICNTSTQEAEAEDQEFKASLVIC